MSVRVKISIDKNAVGIKIKAASEKAVAVTAEQALSDCNRFCPGDQGTLSDSSYSNSDLKAGLLVWSAPYARYLYYGLLMVDSKTGSAWARKGDKKVLTNKPLTYHKRFKSSTPCKLWCEKARENYNEDWRLIFQNSLRGNL